MSCCPLPRTPARQPPFCALWQGQHAQGGAHLLLGLQVAFTRTMVPGAQPGLLGAAASTCLAALLEGVSTPGPGPQSMEDLPGEGRKAKQGMVSSQHQAPRRAQVTLVARARPTSCPHALPGRDPGKPCTSSGCSGPSRDPATQDPEHRLSSHRLSFSLDEALKRPAVDCSEMEFHLLN